MTDDPGASTRQWIITGAAGFLGNTLVRCLLERGERVRALVHGTKPQPSLDGLDCELLPVDVTDEASLVQAFTTPNGERSIVVHCAGIVSIASRVTDRVRHVNVEGTRTVIAACRRAQVGRLVYVSSVHAITEPSPARTIIEVDHAAGFDAAAVTGEYSKTKAEATALVLSAADVDHVVVHPSGMIGPHDFADSHLTRLIRDAMSGRLTSVVSGGYVFVDTRDVATGIVTAALTAPAGRTYLLTGHYATVEALAHEAAKASGTPRRFHVLPFWFAKGTAPLAELFYRIRGTKPLYTDYSLHTLRAPADFSHARATTELGYEPRALTETIRDTVTWLAAHPSD